MFAMLCFTDGDNYDELLGSLDYAFLFTYAIGMFFRYCELRYSELIGKIRIGITVMNTDVIMSMGKNNVVWWYNELHGE